MDMICHMAEYLAGPGQPGFTAWMDQKYPGGLINSEIIRLNMEIIRERIGAA
jgi:hypothetical protein